MASYGNPHSPTSQGIEETVYTVPISSLIPSDSPRLDGESQEHIRMLAASESKLPPLLVHRKTLRVIDGMHRLRAAILRNDQSIWVRYFDGNEASAFVLAVQSNVTHGLPLSLADRTAAAKRIIDSHPQWSDRSIASVTGLSPKTIAAVRARVADSVPRPNVRIGRDGKAHPLDATEGRRRASRMIAENPSASLREIAEAAGISVGTAHNVRERLRQGQDPAPPGRNAHKPAVNAADRLISQANSYVKSERKQDPDPAMILRALKRDPSLRHTETGRALLRLFDAQALCAERWERLIVEVPPHCADMIIDMAVDCTRKWNELAENLRSRKRKQYGA